MRTKFKHKIRGSFYSVLGAGYLQTNTPLADNHPLIFYEGDDGKMWARCQEEFHDGRFQEIGWTYAECIKQAYSKLGEVEDLLNYAGASALMMPLTYVEKAQKSLAETLTTLEGRFDSRVSV